MTTCRQDKLRLHAISSTNKQNQTRPENCSSLKVGTLHRLARILFTELCPLASRLTSPTMKSFLVIFVLFVLCRELQCSNGSSKGRYGPSCEVSYKKKALSCPSLLRNLPFNLGLFQRGGKFCGRSMPVGFHWT